MNIANKELPSSYPLAEIIYCPKAFAQRLANDTKNKIVHGDDESYGCYHWEGISDLADLLKVEGGLADLQRTYDKAKASLTGKKQRILNPESQLLALGIVL